MIKEPREIRTVKGRIGRRQLQRNDLRSRNHCRSQRKHLERKEWIIASDPTEDSGK